MAHILGDDEQVVEAIFFLQRREIGHHFTDEVLGLSVDAEAVFELVVVLGDHCMVLWGEGTCGENRHLLVFGQKRHCCQCGLGSNRTAHNEIGFLVQDQFFDSQKGFAHRNSGFQVPGVDGLDLERSFLAADMNSARGVDLFHRENESSFCIPTVKKRRGQRAAENDGRLGRKDGGCR